ncbi:MAG: ATP-binding protein [Candidatus Altiarchaeota archaeon]|nr:ATP-binding protein [Candidatus Altiarchaeota archaeon]
MDEVLRSVLERQNPWWFEREFDCGIDRLAFFPKIGRFMAVPEVLILLGARRSGKSTILFQVIRDLLSKGVAADSVLFVNLEEPFFQSRAKDPNLIPELFDSYFSQFPRAGKFFVFLDEAQNNDYWSAAVKSFYDSGRDVKMILTGSTSSLVESTAASRLSGRYFSVRVHPLSYTEFLGFAGGGRLTVAEKRSRFDVYLKYGGFPRVVLEKDSGLKQDLLKNYFQTIYLRDIIYPHKLRNNREVFDLLYYALSNIGKPFSYTNAAKALSLSPDTVREYLSYAEDSYLLFSVSKYDDSVKKQIVNPRKIYCLDTGIVNAVSFQFSENRGRLLENLVHAHLRRRHEEIYYHRGEHECDFLVREGRRIVSALQVSSSIRDAAVKKREVSGLLEAMEEHKLSEGIILTESEEGSMEEAAGTVKIVPLYKWLEEK